MQEWNIIEFHKLTPTNLSDFIHLQKMIIPIIYDEKFYRLLLKEYYGYFLMVDELVIGIISYCIKNEAVYLMTFGIIAEFRCKGFGRMALKMFKDKIFKDFFTSTVYLHVNAGNLGAAEFYRKNGYYCVNLVKDYYKSIQPRDAWLYMKRF